MKPRKKHLESPDLCEMVYKAYALCLVSDIWHRLLVEKSHFILIFHSKRSFSYSLSLLLLWQNTFFFSGKTRAISCSCVSFYSSGFIQRDRECIKKSCKFSPSLLYILYVVTGHTFRGLATFTMTSRGLLCVKTTVAPLSWSIPVVQLLRPYFTAPYLQWKPLYFSLSLRTW